MSLTVKLSDKALRKGAVELAERQLPTAGYSDSDIQVRLHGGLVAWWFGRMA